MARIESGIPPETAGQFWLKGQTLGLGQAQDQREEARKREAELHDTMLKIQKAALAHKQEEAKAMALLNAQAQMGDAQALQNLSAKIHAGEHPDAAILKDAMGTMQRLTDPKARALAMQAFGSAMKDLQAQRARSAAEQATERAVQNGLEVDPEAIKGRLDSGENPELITRELHKAEQDRNVKTMASEKAMEAIAQAEALVQSAPPGHRKLAAKYILTHFKNAPSDQEKPGADAKFLEEVQRALLPTQKEMDEQAEGKKEHLQEALGPNAEAKGLGGMTVGEMQGELEKEPRAFDPFGVTGGKGGFHGGPDIPPLDPSIGTHATLRGKKGKGSAAAAKQSVGPLALSLLQESENELDLAKKLKAQGVKLTPAIMAEVKAALDQRRNEVNASAGADQ